MLEAAMQAGVAFLQRARNPDGSWGYEPGQPGRNEPSVLAAMAGQPLAKQWLMEQPRDWSTLLLPAVAAGQAPDWSQELGRWILSLAGKQTNTKNFDGGLRGWSWVEGTASWIEPTAYALLSLERLQMGADRRSEARAMLLDRQCHDGGWNYGNPQVFKKDLPSQLGPTGWAILALPSGSAVDAGLKLMETALHTPSTAALALGTLAHVHHGRDGTPFANTLAQRMTKDGVRARCDLTALTVTALRAALSQTSPFPSVTASAQEPAPK